MALLTPDEGEVSLLSAALGKTTPANQVLHLFTNNHTPADADTAAAYTEMTGLGYTAIELDKTLWTVANDSATGKAVAVHQQQTFNFTSGTPTNLYGYYITDKTSGKLLWAELFDTPKTVQFTGDQILITPRFTLSKE